MIDFEEAEKQFKQYVSSYDMKNENIKNLKVGMDYHFYAKKEEKLFGTILIPISDEEAGVIDIYKNIRVSNIEIRLDYPQELKSVEIPTMLLQPIVENSFVHGMRGMDELFIVCLSAKGIRDEQGKLSEMILSVEDNGIGMDEEAVERLTKGKRTEPDEKDRKKVFRNIGVPNIIERLKMLYGDRAKLTVTSGENGTTIQIRLPADGEKKEII